jgi:chromosome condensin MukBEF MukE localization factor
MSRNLVSAFRKGHCLTFGQSHASKKMPITLSQFLQEINENGKNTTEQRQTKKSLQSNYANRSESSRFTRQRLDIYVLEEVNVLSLLLVVWKMSTGSSDLVPVVKLVFRLGCLKG